MGNEKQDPENYAKQLRERDISEEEKFKAYTHYHTINVLAEKAKPTWKKKLGSLFDKLAKRREEAKGFLTAEGRFFNYHEWHSLIWGAGLMFLYFLLDNGIFLVLYVMSIAAVFRDVTGHSSCDSKLNYFRSEIAKNLHYFFYGGLIVAAAFIGAGYTPPSVDTGLISAVLSAFLGL